MSEQEEEKYACRGCGKQCHSFECPCGSNKEIWATDSRARQAKYLRLIKSQEV